MLIIRLGVFLVISFVSSSPIWNTTTEAPNKVAHTTPSPICEYPTFWWDQTGFVCNDDKTGYYYCHFNGELQKEVLCPGGQRCICSPKCYVESLDDDIPATREYEVCEMIPPPKRTLPDPALFTYRKVYESEYESDDNKKNKNIFSGEIRQYVRNGYYMEINHNSSDFHMVLANKKYDGNFKLKTCKLTETLEAGPYLNLESLLSGYTFTSESSIKGGGGRKSQTWIRAGSSRYDASEYFWVTVENGFTLLGRYSISEGRDWEDTGDLVSSDIDHYYTTTYGVDSSHWFDVPTFC